MDTIYILGADDAEMRLADALLRECFQSVRFALVPERHGYRRVRPGEAGTTCGTHLDEAGWASEVVDMLAAKSELIAIEVAGPWGIPAIDHHDASERASWGPDRFLQASSLGQVIERLAREGLLPASWPLAFLDGESSPIGVFWSGSEWVVRVGTAPLVIPEALVFEAAADHCLAAAFAGACPGIDPSEGEAFWRYVVEGRRATFAPDLSPGEFAAVFAASLATLRAGPPAFDLLQATRSTHQWFTGCPDPAPPPGTVVRLTSAEHGLAGWGQYVQMGDGGDFLTLGGGAALVRDLTHLPIDGPMVAATGEQYPAAFQFGPLIGSVAGLGYIVRIRRRDGRIAFRLGGCGEGAPAGAEPIRRWMAGAGEARGCLPATAAPPDNLYGVPERGFGGGTLA